jgi:hypothetical protein
MWGTKSVFALLLNGAMLSSMDLFPDDVEKEY